MESTSAAEPSTSEVVPYLGRCSCCYEYGIMRNMWSEYYWEGILEIYGEMLMETFSLTGETMKENICELCVKRLREASNFRKDVLATEQLMTEELTNYESKLDLENFDMEVKVEHFDDNTVVEYYEVEYLEDDEGSKAVLEPVESEKELAKDSEPAKEQKVRKWPRKKKPEEKTRTYKNYTAHDLRQCLEAIQEGVSVTDAAQIYGIPRKTVAAKVKAMACAKPPETPEEIEKFCEQEDQYNFIQEIKLILTYTNAVPFKVKGCKFFCAYCYTTKENFDDPDDLRIHSRSHEDEWVQNIDRILRPHFLNEVLRVDIESLCCVACNLRIKKWTDLFPHLRDHHQLHFEQCLTKLIPYRLKRDWVHCVLCEKKFPNFAFVDSHMNSHFCNYMCSDCGDTYLSETRLKQHLQIHNIGKHKCEECGKFFTLDKYLRKHEALVHKKVKSFKCMYCEVKFHSDTERHAHIVANHSEKVRIVTCEKCGKTFNWRPAYLAHMRKVHNAVKKNMCRYCDKAFVSKHEMNIHEQRHTGTGKHYCKICSKNFVTMMELKSHLNKHVKEMIHRQAS